MTFSPLEELEKALGPVIAAAFLFGWAFLFGRSRAKQQAKVEAARARDDAANAEDISRIKTQEMKVEADDKVAEDAEARLARALNSSPAPSSGGGDRGSAPANGPRAPGGGKPS